MTEPIREQLRAAADRLQKQVIDATDWAYVEGNTDPGEHDLRDDLLTVWPLITAGIASIIPVKGGE